VGTNNWGSSTTGTNNTTSTPSAWDTISGLMSSGGALAKGLTGFNLGGTPGTAISGTFGPSSYGGANGPTPLV
jgi:hypothetical protein